MLRNFDKDLLASGAIARSVPIKSSIKKLKLVADTIYGMNVSDALLKLAFCRKKVAYDFYDVLKAAISNAENNFGRDIDKLYVAKIYLGKAYVLKRMMAGARGRGKSIKKRYSKISIIVSEREV